MRKDGRGALLLATATPTASFISIEGPVTRHLTNKEQLLLSEAWSLSGGNPTEIVISLVHQKHM